MSARQMDMMDRLAKERRARLAAERLLEHKSRELVAANEKLALHARALSEQVMAQRAATVSALSQAETLKDQNTRFLSDLDRAHTAAVMAERRLWDSIDTIRDGFAVFDAGHRLVAANSAWVALFGAEAHAPGTEWPVILTDALARDLFHLDETRTAFVERMLARWEGDVIAPETLCRTNGIWLRLTERRARDGDIVALAIDITEEMRLWAAIDALPDGMAIFDNEERLVICNQRFRDLQGLPSDVAYPGAGLETILRAGLDPLDPDGNDWVARRLAQHRAPQGAVEGCLDDGRWLRSETHVTPDGGRVAICRDISDARAAEAAVLAARDQAEAASRAKSAFLANMSHEIRTPMNGVVGMAELLCDTPLTEDQRLFADTIRSSGEALLAIINDILDYSKLEAARLTIHAEPFDLERLIHEVAMLLQPRAQEKRLDLMIDYDMFLPTRFVGDAGRLRQVLTNLVGNAVKFTDQGHVLIRVVGFPADEGRQQLHVTVEDTGIGIATEHLDHIFGEFNQVEDAANRRFEGTGLGLAITRRIVERMAGAVWVDSELGRGSSFGFRLTLPIAEEASAPALPPQLRRVLVVDDQFLNRTILDRQLSPCGIAVTLCRSGAEALAALAQGALPDVVVTDHVMPDMDGLTLARQIRAAGHDLPVVVLSSNPAALRDTDGSDGIAAILQKPILRADLYRRLAAVTVPPVPPPKPARSRPMRVLVAEDNRTNQLVFQKMVRDAGVEVIFAANGAEAVALWQTHRPDLIFMDISMPEMDGRAAAFAIRSAEGGQSRVPILALTAHAMEDDGPSILAAGIDQHLTKPLKKSVILTALAHHCPDEAIPPMGQEVAA